MSRRFMLTGPAVVAEVIDDEAVIMHLQQGHYFSATGSGAVAWQALAQGHPEPAVAAALARAYGVSEDAAAAAVARFAADAVAHDLLRERPDAPDDDAPDALVASAGGPWAPPALVVYTDMEDLLLLDPIHDVGAAGWPMPKDDAAA